MRELLSDMMILQAWLNALRLGTHQNSEAGWSVMCNRFDACFERVEKLMAVAPPDVIAALDSAPAAPEGNVVAFPVVRRPPPGAQHEREAFAGDVARTLEVLREARSGALGPRPALAAVPDEGDVA